MKNKKRQFNCRLFVKIRSIFLRLWDLMKQFRSFCKSSLIMAISLSNSKGVKKNDFLKRINNIVKTAFQNLKAVNWYIEIIKAILTSFIILLISTTIFGAASYFSPGEYTDDRLKQYLLKAISHEIGVEYSENGITISRVLYGLQNGIATEDIIVLCGEYATDPSFIDVSKAIVKGKCKKGGK